MGRELRNLVVKIDERINNLICLKKEILYHFSLLKNEFQKPKKLKESP